MLGSRCDELQQRYAMRVAAEEIRYMERALMLQNTPHIASFLERPSVKFLLRHAQNFCWTVERWGRRLRDVAGRRPVTVMPAPSVRVDRVLRSNFGAVTPTIWIDMTDTYRAGCAGGIGRVTSKLAEEAIATGLAMPVFVEDGDIYEYVGFAHRGRRLQITPDVVLVIADCFWSHLQETREMCDAVKANGAKVVILIHDIIPLYFPSFSRIDLVKEFTDAVKAMVTLCDSVIAVSRYSAERTMAWVQGAALREGRPLPISHFHLGSNSLDDVDISDVDHDIIALFSSGKIFLSVGTLEPRKGYAVTLDAFDALWDRDVDATFVIIGRSGWISKSLENRIVEHPRFGTKLIWLSEASDATLAYAYRNAYCLIQASVTEGFGLPIVEAARAGAPIIAADIPVFRELAGDHLTYFRVCDSVDLERKIEASLTMRPRPIVLPLLTWRESLEVMVERIRQMTGSPMAREIVWPSNRRQCRM